MFVVGVCIGNEAKYQEWALRGLEHVREPDTRIVELRNQTSIFRAYNEVLDAAREHDDLEGVLLIHEDVLIRDRTCFDKLRDAFAEPGIGMVGVYGCRAPRSLSWHTEPTTFGFVEEPRFLLDKTRQRADVDVLDGLFLALSPRAAQVLRFDDGHFTGFHGYDADICLQARAAGLRVVTEFIDVYHATKGTFGDRVGFIRTNLAWRAKWCGSPYVDARMRTWDTRRGIKPLTEAFMPMIATLSGWRHAFGAWRRGMRVDEQSGA